MAVQIQFGPPGLASVYDEDQLTPFYNQLKDTIVDISSIWNRAERKCSGTYVTSNGHILVPAHQFSSKPNPIKIRSVQNIDDHLYKLGEMVHMKKEMNLALIKRIDPVEPHNYVTFARDEEIDIGEDVLMMSHVTYGTFTKQRGMISYYCDYRTKNSDDCKLKKSIIHNTHALSICSRDLPFVELSGIHTCERSFGAPVFNLYGRMVGMHTYATPKFEYAIHAHQIGLFLSEYDELIKSSQTN